MFDSRLVHILYAFVWCLRCHGIHTDSFRPRARRKHISCPTLGTAQTIHFSPGLSSTRNRTLWCGPSSGFRPGSLSGLPMTNSPLGMGIIPKETEVPGIVLV